MKVILLRITILLHILKRTLAQNKDVEWYETAKLKANWIEGLGNWHEDVQKT